MPESDYLICQFGIRYYRKLDSCCTIKIESFLKEVKQESLSSRISTGGTNAQVVRCSSGRRAVTRRLTSLRGKRCLVHLPFLAPAWSLACWGACHWVVKGWRAGVGGRVSTWPWGRVWAGSTTTPAEVVPSPENSPFPPANPICMISARMGRNIGNVL